MIQTFPAITVTAKKVITERLLTTCMPMINANPQKTDSLMKVDTETPVAVLGVLAGLLAVALAFVLAGWVWTCWIMKKRSNRTQLHTKYQVSIAPYIYIYRICHSLNLITKHKECKEKQSYPNPTYGTTTDSHPATAPGTDSQMHSQEEENRRQTRANNQRKIK